MSTPLKEAKKKISNLQKKIEYLQDDINGLKAEEHYIKKSQNENEKTLNEKYGISPEEITKWYKNNDENENLFKTFQTELEELDKSFSDSNLFFQNKIEEFEAKLSECEKKEKFLTNLEENLNDINKKEMERKKFLEEQLNKISINIIDFH